MDGVESISGLHLTICISASASRRLGQVPDLCNTPACAIWSPIHQMALLAGQKKYQAIESMENPWNGLNIQITLN